MIHKVEIFNIEGQDTMSACASGSCSSCASGCATPSNEISIPELAQQFESLYPHAGQIKRHILTGANLVEVAERLQAIYENSHESLIITEGNVRFILSRLAPIVAVDDLLATVNYIPDPEELMDYLTDLERP